MIHHFALQQFWPARHPQYGWLRAVATAGVAAVLLAGCGGGGGDGADASASPPQLQAGPPTTSDSPADWRTGSPEGQFSAAGTLATPRSGHSATLLQDGKVLIIGDAPQPELFDPADGSSTPTGLMISAYPGAGTTVLPNGHVLVMGGWDADYNLTAEIYDPATGTFALTGPPVTQLARQGATLLKDGRVLFAGGAAGDAAGAATADAQVYDPESGRFSAVGSMLSARSAHTATLLKDGRVLIEGGWNGHRADSADDPPWDPMFAELFDPTTSTFVRAADMSTTRSGGPTATRLASGDVLVFGGIWSLQNTHEQPPHPAYAEIYDVAANSFQPFDVPLQWLGRASATLLPDGRVLLIGSDDSTGLSSSAALLDPDAKTLVWAGDLLTPRSGFTVTGVADGRVLIVGGTDRYGNALASVEVWTPENP